MPKKKKIAFVIDKLAQRGGGAERVLIEVANSLARRGHHIEIVTHEYRGRPPAYPLEPGIILNNLRPHRRSRFKQLIQPMRKALNTAHSIPLIDRVVWLNRHGAFWRRLGQHLSATRPDVAIAFMPPAITALAYAKVSHDMLRVASTHNAPAQDYENPARWDPSRLDRKRRLQCLDRLDKICVLLPEYANYYELDAGKVVVLPNAVTPAETPVPARQRAPLIVASGRLERVKRHDLSVLAWRQIQDKFPDWSLQIFGEGSMRKSLETLIVENRVERVKLMGHRSDILNRVGKAAVLSHPATYEGFPLAVCEALAAGTPVVGFSDCSGLNYLVEDEVNGLLVPPSDRVANFARTLERILSDAELRETLSLGGPPSIAQYSPEAVTEIWEDILYGRR